jgi:hypothetical protein
MLGVRHRLLNPVWKPIQITNRTDTHFLGVDSLSVGKFAKFRLDKIEQWIQFRLGPIEILSRKRIKREFLNPEFRTPVENGFCGGRTGSVAFRNVITGFSGVPPVTILNNCDMCGALTNLSAEQTFVCLLEDISDPMNHK